MFVIPDNRTGFSMRVDGVHLNRPDLHILAAELGIGTNDVLVENGVLTVYNTSESCQEIIDDNALAPFVAMTLNISVENISEMTAVQARPRVLEKDDDFGFDDDED